jgi:hypothetical protein
MSVKDSFCKYAKEPYITVNEPYGSALTSAKEPYIPVKEPPAPIFAVKMRSMHARCR